MKRTTAVKENTKEITKEARDLQAVREVARRAKENGLRECHVEDLNKEGISIEHKIVVLVMNSLNQLSLIKAILNNDDMFKLEGYELAGVTNAVNDIDNMLAAAADLYLSTN